MDLNKVQLIGRVTSDCELKNTPSGQSVCTFSVATNRTWKDSSGSQQESAEFSNIVSWGKLAEIISTYGEKGKRIYVEGRLQTRNWDDNGTKKYRTEIIAENIIFLDSAKKNDGFDDFNTPPAQKTQPKKQPSYEEEISIEDLPFNK